MKKLVILLSFAGILVAGVVTKTNVQSATGTGYGASYEQAVDKALAQAVAKLNGAYLTSSKKSQTNLNSVNGNDTLKENFEHKISVATKGRFSSYDVISQQQTDDGFEVTVKVIKRSSSKFYKVPGQNTNKNNLVIVARYNNLDLARFGKEPLIVAHDLKAQLSNEIYKARKFRLLDRDNQAITNLEESYIKNNTNKDEALRLGMNLGADYMLLYDITRLGFDKGKASKFSTNKADDTISMVANVQVILLATKEIKYSTTINFSRSYKNINNSTYTQFIADAAAEIANQLHSGIYPPMIEQVVNNEAVFTQKLPVGAELDCYAKGNIVVDSRTKEKSYVENYTALVKVVRNNEKQSYADVVSGKISKGNICRVKSNVSNSNANNPNAGVPGAFVPKEYGGGF